MTPIRILASGALCVAALACEDSRPASAPRTPGNLDAVARRWNALAARLEADNEPRVHARLAPAKDAELSEDVVRAASALHDARRVLDNLHLGLPDQARDEMLERARASLDEADGPLRKADAIRAGSEPSDAAATPATSGAIPTGDASAATLDATGG